MFTQITVTGTYRTPAGVAPNQGQVTFTLYTSLTDETNTQIPTDPIVVQLDSDGSFSQVLAATNDPTTRPIGIPYLVAENIDGATRRYYVTVPYNAPGGTVDLAALAPTTTPVPQFQYATEADITTAISSLVDIPTVVTLDNFSPFLGCVLTGLLGNRFDALIGDGSGSYSLFVGPPFAASTPQTFDVRLPALPEITVTAAIVQNDTRDGFADVTWVPAVPTDFTAPQVWRLISTGIASTWTVQVLVDPDVSSYTLAEGIRTGAVAAFPTIDLSLVPFVPFGLFNGVTDVLSAIISPEGFLDNLRYTDNVLPATGTGTDDDPYVIAGPTGPVDLTTLEGAPVADEDQPFGLGGVQVAKGQVIGVLNLTDGSLLYSVDSGDGHWIPINNDGPVTGTNLLAGGFRLWMWANPSGGSGAAWYMEFVSDYRPNGPENFVDSHPTGRWQILPPGPLSGVGAPLVTTGIDGCTWEDTGSLDRYLKVGGVWRKFTLSGLV